MKQFTGRKWRADTFGVPWAKPFHLFWPEKWPVQNKNTSIQYSVQISNTEVSISVFTIKNTESIISISTRKNWSISIQYQYSYRKIASLETLVLENNHIKFVHEVGMKRSKDCSNQFVKQASSKKGLGNHNGIIHKKRNHFIALFVI